MLRAFLAIDPPGSLRPGLARVQEELKLSGADVRWVPVGNIHLTLKFFGQLPEDEVEPLSQAALGVAAGLPPFSLRVAGTGAFPNLKSPRVVWLGLEGDLEVLQTFHRRLEAAFATLGHLPEGRPLHPHLTLGRVRSPAGRERLSRMLQDLPRPGWPSFQVSEVVLFRSNLSPQGATYTPLKVISLG
jgi:2'-5' RNA ligase